MLHHYFESLLSNIKLLFHTQARVIFCTIPLCKIAAVFVVKCPRKREQNLFEEQKSRQHIQTSVLPDEGQNSNMADGD